MAKKKRKTTSAQPRTRASGKRIGETVSRRPGVTHLHRQTLIEMNASVNTARRDAAYARVRQLLTAEILDNTKTRRSELYAACLALLDEALVATERSQVQKDTPVTHYLRLIRDTVGASQALLHHELVLVREAEDFARLLGAERVAQLQSADDVFRDSEANILRSIDGLLSFGEPVLQEDTRQRESAFSEDDRRRYRTALAEFREFYGSQ